MAVRRIKLTHTENSTTCIAGFWEKKKNDTPPVRWTYQPTSRCRAPHPTVSLPHGKGKSNLLWSFHNRDDDLKTYDEALVVPLGAAEDEPPCCLLLVRELIVNDEREQDVESERSSKDNEEREEIEEGAQENFGFSKFASKRSFKRSSTASTSF